MKPAAVTPFICCCVAHLYRSAYINNAYSYTARNIHVASKSKCQRI